MIQKATMSIGKGDVTMTVFNPWIEITRKVDNATQLINLDLVESITCDQHGATLWWQGIGDGNFVECKESYEEIFEMIKEKYKCN